MKNITIKNNYMYQGDKLFYWQGDTAWLLFEKLSLDEIKLYLDNRKCLGFNVIQVTLIHQLEYINERDKEYFVKCREAIRYADSIGLYIGLLPCWGALVKEKIINDNNIDKYATFLMDFFKDETNIIWILGGDIRADVNMALYCKLGNMFKNQNKDRLVTFHPFGRTGSYLWLNDEKWLDFNMFQSGHRRYDQTFLGEWDDKTSNEDSFGEDNYQYVFKNKTYKIQKPILDAEPSYEGIVQGLHDFKEPCWEASDVRRYAYWSVFAGACGFTYGHNSIMQFYRGNEYGNYNVSETWLEALHAEGASQMQILKNLFIEYNFGKMVSKDDLVISNRERYHYTAVIASRDAILAYNYMGDVFNINTSDFKDGFKAYFLNPQSGIKSYIGSYPKAEKVSIRPTRRKEGPNDWVLILEGNHD